ncbi:DNRLRE domain-containing protein [Micromonospora sp. NPDC050495]|uniref:CBM96 family carbohydrate-binding protein n=1 Tax=Micromonospora sp. NPDC050495 TaxID=3154936 RepID=UPI0033CED01B
MLSAATLLSVAVPGAVAASGTSTPAGAGAPAGTTEVRIPVAADTYVVQEMPTIGYGSATKLAASNWSTPWHSEIYLRFPLPATPAGRRVVSARLELAFQKLTEQPAALRLHPVASTSWSESITYANRPAMGPAMTTVDLTGQGTTSVSFDVTDVVGQAAGARSFAVTNPSAESAAVVNSRERGTDVPTIVISYVTTTLCGTSYARENGESWPEGLAREEALFGPLGAVRFFHGGPPPAWPGPLDVGSRALVVSFKGNARDYLAGRYDDQMRQWFAGAPRDRDVYWVYYHEPEDNIRDGEFTAADYRAAWRRLSALADEAGNPRLFATQVLMQWTVVPASGRDWRDYYPGDGVLDVLAWDIYNYDAAKGRYLAPATLVDPAVAVNTTVGLPIAVAELGSHIATGDDGTARAVWVRAINQYLGQRGSRWNLWFDLSWPTGDYRLRDPAGVSAWRDFCQGA